jgi:hypothetical protein
VLLGTDPSITRSIVSQLSFRSQLDLAASLIASKLGAEAAAKFRPTASLLAQAAESRNNIAHSMWGAHISWKGDLATATKFSLSRKVGLNRRQSDVHPADLKAIAVQISVATYELVRFHSESDLRDFDMDLTLVGGATSSGSLACA